MLSLNPRTDLPHFIFDDNFWIPKICQKYDLLLESKEYPIDDIREVVAESLKSWEIPGLTQEVIKQKQYTGDLRPNDVNYPAYENKQSATGKTLVLTFRMNDAMINWSCLFEHMWAKLDNDKKLVTSTFPVIVRNQMGLPIFNMVFKDALFTGIEGFGVDYTNFDRSYKEFTCTWELDKFLIDFTPPHQNVKGYNPVTGTTSIIDYNRDEPDVDKPCKPSLSV